LHHCHQLLNELRLGETFLSAPADWSFRSIEELEDDDQADWWKAEDPE
jgi:hypothetical protein